MEERSNATRLADALDRAIRRQAAASGISIKEARALFARACENEGRAGEYDPRKDPSHPMNGWRP